MNWRCTDNQFFLFYFQHTNILIFKRKEKLHFSSNFLHNKISEKSQTIFFSGASREKYCYRLMSEWSETTYELEWMKKRSDFSHVMVVVRRAAVVLSAVTNSDEFILSSCSHQLCSKLKSMLSKACFSYYLSWNIFNFDWYKQNDIKHWVGDDVLALVRWETTFICLINFKEQVAFCYKNINVLKNFIKKVAYLHTKKNCVMM